MQQLVFMFYFEKNIDTYNFRAFLGYCDRFIVFFALELWSFINSLNCSTMYSSRKCITRAIRIKNVGFHKSALFIIVHIEIPATCSSIACKQ